MAIAGYSRFHDFKNLIQSIPASHLEEEMLDEQFLLEKNEKKKLEIYYAPFEYVNPIARILIVGITPGLHQMKKSYTTVINARNQIENDEEILRQVKNNSSFEGPMRKNLVQMLDELGLHEYLGLTSTMSFFNESSNIVQTTSIIPYPVFYNGKNFNGSTPNILKNEILKKYVTEFFASEMRKLNNPLIIPLGVNVSNALNYLSNNDLLDVKNFLSGFPHPSGGNGHRHKQFAENKNHMQEILKTHFQNETIATL
ncbi:uracil-DNA glycosylase family protein [Lederbergia panacisoli]|uniref:uracil-DNA glycosylase family protein n=1 Tax=Lederbergia panacisoli TaxID=1255251 RepID=UPI00214BBF74|nr:uracil-DNA glycosylase family protein [Lederbergia panacisoli]MCR2822938.1 hypothetical protein [Lederbergia panacisoli]